MYCYFYLKGSRLPHAHSPLVLHKQAADEHEREEVQLRSKVQICNCGGGPISTAEEEGGESTNLHNLPYSSFSQHWYARAGKDFSP
jgi:hypothetical protein